MKVVSRFDRLYRDNFPFVWAAAHRCGAPHEAVDDVVQDVFVTAYRRLDELRWEISPHGWLYGVTRRVASRYRRTAARSARRTAAAAATSRRSERPHRRHEAAQALEAMLAQLDETQREAFVMTELLGMSGPEVAAELAVPLNTVYSRLRLARKRLVALAGSENALHDGVAATQRDDTPTRKDMERTYAAIGPALGSQWLTFQASALATAKAVALPAGALAIALTSYAVTRSMNDGIEEEAPAAAAPKRERKRPAGPYVPAEPKTTDPERQVTPAAVAPAPAPSTTSTPAPPANNAAATAPTPKPDATLAAEVALIDQAKAALDRDEATAALVALQEHASRFPRGQLAQARESTRVRALCKAGRAAEAEAAADALHRAHPDSNVVRQTPKKCATP